MQLKTSVITRLDLRRENPPFGVVVHDLIDDINTLLEERKRMLQLLESTSHLMRCAEMRNCSGCTYYRICGDIPALVYTDIIDTLKEDEVDALTSKH